jgi:RimJ/RimL family protein N-acetyltransferase
MSGRPRARNDAPFLSLLAILIWSGMLKARIMNVEIVAEDFLDFKCPYCGALNSFPASAAGLARECVNCLEILLVPATDGDAARKLPLPIESSRIRLRKFEAGDWKDLLEYQFEEEDEATGWIHRISSPRLTEERPPFYLAIEARDAHKVVGTLGFNFLDQSFNQVELTLNLNTAADLPTVDVEAFDAALEFCFEELNLHRVITQCRAEDSECRQLLNAIGMRQEAEFVKHTYVAGEWISVVWFAMLEEEYFKDTAAGSEKTS